MKKKFIKEEHPRKQMIELILKGDQADGIPNVLSNDDVFVEGIRQTPLRKNIIEELTKDPLSMGKEIYRNYQRNYKLINLSMTPDLVKEEIIYNYESQKPPTDKKLVFNHLIDKRCRMLLENVEEFV